MMTYIDKDLSLDLDLIQMIRGDHHHGQDSYTMYLNNNRVWDYYPITGVQFKILSNKLAVLEQINSNRGVSVNG